MKLVWFTIEGFRRFSTRSKINVDTKLVAIVGPNEAGKTSILAALEHLNHQTAFRLSGSSQETTRGQSVSPEDYIIEASFLLEDEDRQAISHIPEASEVRWFSLFKKARGGLETRQIPEPERDLEPRRLAITALDAARSEIETLSESTTGESSEDDATKKSLQLDAVREVLSNEDQTLPNTKIKILQRQANMLDPIVEGGSKQTQAIPGILRAVAESESLAHPVDSAGEALLALKPRILFFSDDHRLLESEYNLEEFFKDKSPLPIPTALNNLAGTAGLVLRTLYDAATIGDTGLTETLLDNANKQLRVLLKTNWSQSPINVRLRLNGRVLYVLAQSPGGQFDRVAERSDGLRQFLALLMFLSRQPGLDVPPIVLIDEVERHLHYDAQADLVQMLARQEVAAKIVYTTHSLGCLPEDLGLGVRVVEAKAGDHLSRINNWFWNSDHPGFSQLLFSMGASTLAFLPMRFAVLTEGATDMILLPALLKEVLAVEHLGFQVAPGLSSATGEQLALVKNESPRMAFLTDNDESGRNLHSKIRTAGIPDRLVHSLPKIDGADTVLEDFLEPKSYVRAINEELRRSHGDGCKIDEAEIPRTGRANALDKWCQTKGINSPSKRAIAYLMLEARHEEKLAAEEFQAVLKTLYEEISTSLKS